MRCGRAALGPDGVMLLQQLDDGRTQDVAAGDAVEGSQPVSGLENVRSQAQGCAGGLGVEWSVARHTVSGGG